MADTGCTACPTAAPPLPDTRPLPAAAESPYFSRQAAWRRIRFVEIDTDAAGGMQLSPFLFPLFSPRRVRYTVESDTYLILSCHAGILLGSLEFMGVTFFCRQPRHARRFRPKHILHACRKHTTKRSASAAFCPRPTENVGGPFCPHVSAQAVDSSSIALPTLQQFPEPGRLLFVQTAS